MKKCDCEHWETCMICYPQGFDAQGKRKPVEVPPSREELQAKVAEITDKLKYSSMAATAEAQYANELKEELTRAEELIEEQLGTIKALNIAIGGEESTSTENLIDAHEVDYNEEGLISLCRKLIAENVRMGDTVEFQKAGWSADYDQLTRAEAVITFVQQRLAVYQRCTPLGVEELVKIALAAITEYREGK